MHDPMQLSTAAGKRDGSTLDAAEAVDPATSRLFVVDRASRIEYLIDTGADVSVYPRRFVRGRPPKTTYLLYAANESTIGTYGEIVLHLNLGLRREIRWKFVIADVGKPIIGADMIKYYGLLVDLKNRQLIDPETRLATRGKLGTAEILSIKTVIGDSPFHKILSEYTEITIPTNANTDAKHHTTHHIKTTPGPPVYARPRRLAPDNRTNSSDI